MMMCLCSLIRQCHVCEIPAGSFKNNKDLILKAKKGQIVKILMYFDEKRISKYMYFDVFWCILIYVLTQTKIKTYIVHIWHKYTYSY